MCRELNVSEQTFYRWTAKYAGIQVQEFKRMKEPEQENDRRKKIVAALTRDARMLKDANSRKW